MTGKDLIEPYYAGRPLAFETPEALQEAIDSYFLKCDSRLKTFVDKEGNETTALVPEPYTMSGLALSIGIDRRTLMEYKDNERKPFSHTVKLARDRVQADMERRLYETSNQAGIIFGLKNNYGWRDERIVESTVKQESTVIYRPEKLPEPIEGEIVPDTPQLPPSS